MLRFDYFTAAPERWRADAILRARRVKNDHPDDPLGYADNRIRKAQFGSFERRRWKHIRSLLAREQKG